MERSKKQNVNKAEKATIKTLQEYGALNIEAKVEEIQQMIPFALMHELETIEEDVRRVAGERYGRAGLPGYDRWGSQMGSIRIHDQRIPIRYPRVRGHHQEEKGVDTVQLITSSACRCTR